MSQNAIATPDESPAGPSGTMLLTVFLRHDQGRGIRQRDEAEPQGGGAGLGGTAAHDTGPLARDMPPGRFGPITAFTDFMLSMRDIHASPACVN